MDPTAIIMAIEPQYLSIALLDYILRIREKRRVEDTDVQTLWSQCSDILKETFSFHDVEKVLRTMDEDFLIKYEHDSERQSINITVTTKGELFYDENRSLLSETRRKRFLKRQKRGVRPGTAGPVS